MVLYRKEGVGKRENAFFILEIFRATHRAGLGGGYIPRRWRPHPPAHPDRLHSTGSRADRAKTRAGKYQGRQPPKRWTRCTGLHSIPDRPRGADQYGGGAGERAACPKLCRLGHSAAVQKYISFLNTFVARATENPFTVSQKCDIIMSQD